VLWNTTYLQAAIERLSAAGRPVSDDHLAHLSPLGWQHINLTGDYLWADDDMPADPPQAPAPTSRPFRANQSLEYICARSMYRP
ncbi:hypothetical protein CNY89_28720, partial [Amaricoccus sp. HAR-UPW-R2A-40]